MTGPAIGVLLPRDLPPDHLVSFARRAEELGFAELWVVEDLGFAGGVAQAATALASTAALTVGIGILPAGARNVAFAAMELTTMARLFPGRLRAGIGHGMPAWMRSVGAWPSSPVTLLEEYVRALRALLRGSRWRYRAGSCSSMACSWRQWRTRCPRCSPVCEGRNRSASPGQWPTG
jgi:5,10-methylenetetrahydromethanopterin reductase